jgi:acyl transferase domain-containing protein/acyl carrier protein
MPSKVPEDISENIQDSLVMPNDLIAIIGISCRFPGANNYHQFWRNLQQGINSITEIPSERWDIDKFYSTKPEEPNKSISKWGGFIEGIDQFDAQFFGISPREAQRMDPQQRLMLELSWSCIEDAGYAPSQLSGSSVGVFIGVCNYDYDILQNGYQQDTDGHTGTGTWTSIIPNRISYFLNFRGPSIPVDTACSSSLVAIHQAIKALKDQECKTALVGGVSIFCTPTRYIQMSKLGMLSPQGQCKTFDSEADGYVRGEGAGVILLKPLAKAIEDKDHIYGVIRGSAVNHGGRAKTLTSPNVYAQAQVLCSAYTKANVAPNTISYIEAHGTGTPLGDPIEINGLKRAFKQLYQQYDLSSVDKPYCGLGTVKTNIGHLEAAAGIAGVIKVLLAMKNQELPKIVNFQQLNPRIDFKKSPFYLVCETQQWKQLKTEEGEIFPRRAGVSSFGVGGVNAHVVLEEAPVLTNTVNEVERPLHILTLSAKSKNALKQVADNYQVITSQGASLTDICFSANTGRSHFAHRASFVAASTDELRKQLQAFVDGDGNIYGVFTGQSQSQKLHKIVFLFTGQGSQYIGMARQLYQTQPSFRKTLEQCDQLLRPYLDISLLSVLYPADNTAELLNQTIYTQPVLFALEYALAQLWLSLGIIPDAVIGHSLGEYVAACIAGVFSLEDGLKLIAERSRLMQSLSENGMMAAIFADVATVETAIAPYGENVCIAAVNGATNIVISGVKESIETAIAQLQAQQITVQVLNVSHAFHSSLMNPILDKFEQKLSQVKFAPLRLPLASNLTGEILQPGEMLGLSYWTRHLRSSVQFASGIQALAAQGYDLFIEIGSHPTLINMGKRCLTSENVTWLPSLKKEQDDWQILLNSLGELYIKGVDIDWAKFDQDYLRCRIPLPTYPFERQRYWCELNQKENRLTQTYTSAVHPLLGTQYLAALQIFESQLNTDKLPYLADLQVEGEVVLPVAAYLEMANAAVNEALKLDSYSLLEVAFLKKLSLSADISKTVQTVLSSEASGEITFQVFSLQTATDDQPTKWILHVNGKIQTSSGVPVTAISINEVRTRCTNQISVAEFYQNLESLGVKYDSLLQGIEELWQHEGEALAKVRLAPTLLAEAKAYRIHPALLDTCLQVLSATLISKNLDTHGMATYIPVRVGSMRVWCQPPTQLFSYAYLHPNGDGDLNAFEGDVVLLDETGLIFAEIKGIRLQRVQLDTQIIKQKNITSLAADYILQPAEISDRIQPQIIQLIDQFGLQNYEELLTRLDTLSVVYILRAFEQLGCQFYRHQQISVINLAHQYGVIPQHHRLLGRMLEILQEEGMLNKINECWEVCQLPEELKLQVQSPEALLKQYPKADAELILLQLCGERLAQVLRGECNAVELLFAEGTFSTTERLYQESPAARLNNTLVQEAIAIALSNLPANRKVRILEIGAGTGGTTAYILSKLPSDRVEYVFTDVSYLFTAKAEQKFRDYPFVQYKLLNIEREPLAQGFAPQEFDLILAANVIHATSDLRRTLAHIQQILAPEGMLVLLEATAKSRMLDLIFGLTEGWWKFADADLRPTYPLLSSYQWRSLLLEMGFSSAVSLPQTGEAKQSVILARSAINSWQQMQEFNLPNTNLPLFAQLFQEVKDISPKVESVQLKAVAENIMLAGSPNATQQMLESYLCKQIAKSLGLTTSKLDINEPLNNLGFDSLIAAELKSRIQSDFRISVPIADFLRGMSLVQLASKVSDLLLKFEQSDDWEEGQV